MSPRPLAAAIMFALDCGAFHAQARDGTAWIVHAYYDDEVTGA